MITRFSVQLSLILISATASAAEVRLRSSAVCASSVSRVADVAEVYASDYRVAQSLAELPLCPAPSPGRQRVLTQEDIRQLLDLSGVERKSVAVTGSETVTITAERSRPANNSPRPPLVASGVRQAIFELEQQPTAVQPSVRPAALEKPLSDDTKPVVSAPLIEKGVSVTVYARSAGVRITTSGKAIESGSVGDTIGVELADNKQRVIARVVGPQTVELTTGPNATSAIANVANP